MKFAKMHGQGNDFVVIDAIRQKVVMTPELARRLADRHLGVGCDQVLVVQPPASPENDFRYRIWNADGGEVEQCGNGARCFARFVADEGLTTKREIRVETASGVIRPRIEASGQVTVDMGVPRFGATYALQLEGESPTITLVSMGNPHAVQFVADVDAAPVRTQGPRIETHSDFPRRINAGYVQVVSRGHVRLRVWERGAGETLACGTGACAAVAAGIRAGLLDRRVRVTTHGGDLVIEWPDRGREARGETNRGREAPAETDNPRPVMMTGDAVRVFDGEIEI